MGLGGSSGFFCGARGTLGRGPDMVPVRLALDTERGLRKTFTFQVVTDQLFTPLLTYVSVLNTLSSYEKDFGAGTFTVTGTMKVRGHGEVALDDVACEVGGGACDRAASHALEQGGGSALLPQGAEADAIHNHYIRLQNRYAHLIHEFIVKLD